MPLGAAKSIYLDTAATSLKKPDAVLDAMCAFMRDVGASPGRSAHLAGMEASRVVARARTLVARLFNVKDDSRVIFTLNCTEALNLGLKGILKPGERVVSTSVEHNSVMRPLSALAEERGIRVAKCRADASGIIELEDLERLLSTGAALLVMTHASNVTGAIQPVAEACRMASEKGIPVLMDAAQTAGCIPIDLEKLPAAMLAFSGHKGLFGPQGVGGIILAEGCDPEPLKHGGTGSRSSEERQPVFLPDRYESGTPNTPGLAGLAAGVEYLLSIGVDRVRRGIVETGSIMLSGLSGIPGVRLYGPGRMEDNAGVFSFTVEGRDNAVVAGELEERHGIMTRMGLQCSPSAHRAIGTYPEGTVRASIGHFTTADELRFFLDSLRGLLS